ncbi:hypothetical protein LTR70_000469 [Exophiala xenobiotica]|uniref:BAG domain-containing protein n=1 Tax=Lithohypha guttulata TaxID=1690604 RepID=A0ABR0K0B1_9EURO|nr:hypothetical protein LTR24_008401 [Lithohypha guttulata]KAK5330639.1 hypothetical protein LTR70_000469 [Exophiala xenobiotica]
MYRSSFGQIDRSGGRSPYAAYARDPAGRSVSELYDYVDEQHNVLSPRDVQQAPAVFEDDDAPDVVHISFRGEKWKIDFPPFSIAEEKVQVHHVRDRVARKLGMEGKEGRIKLIYKERDMKRNDTPLRKYGCKQNSEINVVVTQESRDYNGRRERSGSDSDSHVSTNKRSVEDDRRLNRSYSTNRRREEDQIPAYPSSNGYLHPHSKPNTPPRQSSPNRPTQQARQSSPTGNSASQSLPQPTAPAVQPPRADPSTDLGKVQAMRYEFHTDLAPLIQRFLRAPPSDKDERVKEYRRLSEIAFKRVFEPGDAIEPDGPDKDEIRLTRKTLYKEAQQILNELDRFKPQEKH